MTLRNTQDVMRSFNRDTAWLAIAVLGTLIFAAVLLAVQERNPKRNDLTGEARQTQNNLLLDGKPATLFTPVGLNQESSNNKSIPEQAPSVDHGYTEISPREDPSQQMETATSTQTPVEAPSPQINQPDVRVNKNAWSTGHSQDSARVTGPIVRHTRGRSLARPRFVDVKMRLIALSHQSLTRIEGSRGWTLYSRSKKGDRKKVSYTPKTNH